MDFTSKIISLSSIDPEDRTFGVRASMQDAALKASISKTGMLNSPYVLFEEETDRYKIVCGFRRVQAACELGLEKIKVKVLSSSAEEKDIFLLALYDDLSGLPLNLVEKADTVKKMLQYFSEAEMIKKYLPLLDTAPVFDSFEELMRIAGMDPEIKQGIAEGILTKKNALRLAEMDQEGLTLYRFFSKTNLSASKQAEIIDCCCDISKRNGISIEDILSGKDILEILSRDNLTRSQKGDKIRFSLRKKRFPRLTELENTFMRLKQKLGLSKNMRFDPPPFFEGNVYSLHIDFKTLEDLQDACAQIKNLSENPRVRKLLEKEK